MTLIVVSIITVKISDLILDSRIGAIDRTLGFVFGAWEANEAAEGPSGGTSWMNFPFTGTYAGLESVLVLPWNERYTDEHIDYIADSIREAVSE